MNLCVKVSAFHFHNMEDEKNEINEEQTMSKTDSIEYFVDKKNRLTPDDKNVSFMVKSTAKGAQPPILNITKKYIIYTKTSTVVRVIHRQTFKYADMSVDANVASVSLLHFESDLFFVVLVDGSLIGAKVKELPDQSIQCISTPDVIAPSAPSDKIQSVKVLQRTGTEHSTTNVKAGKMVVAFSPDGDVFSSGIDDKPTFSKIATLPDGAPQIAVAGSKRGVLGVQKKFNEFALYTAERFGENLLKKSWFPHEDTAWMHIFDVGVGNDPIIIATMSTAYDELRFWSYENGNMNLNQTIAIAAPADELENGKENTNTTHRMAVVDADEGHLFLLNGGGSMLVFELDAERKAQRVTDWAVAREAVAAAPVFRKVSRGGGHVEREMTVILKVDGNVVRVILDNIRLLGQPNLFKKGEGESTADLADKWFPQPHTKAPLEEKKERATVTSTIGGGSRPPSSEELAATAMKAKMSAIAEQQAMFGSILSQLDGLAVGLERQANDSLSVLRGLGPAAAATGREFAANHPYEHKNGMEHKTSTDVSPVVVEAVTVAVRGAASMTAASAVPKGLRNAAHGAVNTAMNSIDYDKEAPQPRVMSHPSIRALTEVIDKAHTQQNQLFARQKEQESAKMKSMVAKTQVKAKKTMSETLSYFEAMREEITSLRNEVAVVYQTASAPRAGPATSVRSDDQVLATAIELAQTGQWSRSLNEILSVSSPQLLINYLETKIVKENRSNIVSSKIMTLPIFISLMQQLTDNMIEMPGAIPIRIEWVYELTIGYDYLADPDDVDKTAIEQNRVTFDNILDSIEALCTGEHKQNVDRTSRRQLTLVRKALAPYSL